MERSLRGGAAADSECEKSMWAGRHRNKDDTKQMKFGFLKEA